MSTGQRWPDDARPKCEVIFARALCHVLHDASNLALSQTFGAKHDDCPLGSPDLLLGSIYRHSLFVDFDGIKARIGFVNEPPLASHSERGDVVDLHLVHLFLIGFGDVSLVVDNGQ